MADSPPKKGSAYSFEFPVLDESGNLATGAVVSAQVSKDGGAFAGTTNAPTEIGTSGIWTQLLTGTEMTCDRFVVKYVITAQPDVFVSGETVTRQMVDLAFPTVSGRSMDVDAGGGVEVGSMTVGVVDAAALATDAVNEIRDAVFSRAFSAAYSSYTFDELIKLFASVLAGKASGLATTTATYRNLADNADVIVATVDVDGNRTAVTRTP